ncbi:hypothetical protein EON67_03785 [archaeon]|nr:MAG: hypothetical protein EON67_03785 [archaeon]
MRAARCARAASTNASAGGSTGARQLSMEEIVAYCKRQGVAHAGSDLYGSIGTGYDYGPLGTALKRNIQDAWWKDFIARRADCVGIESSIIMNPRGTCALSSKRAGG